MFGLRLMKLKILKCLLLKSTCLFVAFGVFYGFSILYYQATEGFALKHIRSDFSFDVRWQTRTLSETEENLSDHILSQKFSYLGKGCQSYVFESEDGKYVLKFFKYQRLKEREWLKKFSFIPFIDAYQLKKNRRKCAKREGVFKSWKLAFDHLSQETGVVYVHLNKSDHLRRTVHIVDKVGVSYFLSMDDYEFMIQKKAQMLCDEIDASLKHNNINYVNNLLKTLIDQVLSEYRRGFADNDHALMQNTGVFEGEPIHVDVGQFVQNDQVKNPTFYLQELYTKTYKFRLWLREKHPNLCDAFEEHLESVIGEDFSKMKPFWRDQIEIFQESS